MAQVTVTASVRLSKFEFYCLKHFANSNDLSISGAIREIVRSKFGIKEVAENVESN